MLVTVKNSRWNLSENSSCLLFGEDLSVRQIVIKLAASCELHHEHHFFAILEDWNDKKGENIGMGNLIKKSIYNITCESEKLKTQWMSAESLMLRVLSLGVDKINALMSDIKWIVRGEKNSIRWLKQFQCSMKTYFSTCVLSRSGLNNILRCNSKFNLISSSLTWMNEWMYER